MPGEDPRPPAERQRSDGANRRAADPLGGGAVPEPVRALRRQGLFDVLPHVRQDQHGRARSPVRSRPPGGRRHSHGRGQQAGDRHHHRPGTAAPRREGLPGRQRHALRRLHHRGPRQVRGAGLADRDLRRHRAVLPPAAEGAGREPAVPQLLHRQGPQPRDRRGGLLRGGPRGGAGRQQLRGPRVPLRVLLRVRRRPDGPRGGPRPRRAPEAPAGDAQPPRRRGAPAAAGHQDRPEDLAGGLAGEVTRARAPPGHHRRPLELVQRGLPPRGLRRAAAVLRLDGPPAGHRLQ
mmetsp:Transcript_78538/g.222134  ORF Transcript_78538/g.222134 Transcript_78538/m.222134 type:complete len:291 (-) Transcript_78538:1500-2372(-)